MLNKCTCDLSFKDVIDLVIATVCFGSDDYLAEICQEFLLEYQKQQLVNMPVPLIISNNESRRSEIISFDKPFITSSNICTLLMRLDYIEQFKIKHIVSTINHYNILDRKLEIPNSKSTNNITNTEIFIMIKMFIVYYLTVYNNIASFEYNLGLSILNAINK